VRFARAGAGLGAGERVQLAARSAIQLAARSAIPFPLQPRCRLLTSPPASSDPTICRFSFRLADLAVPDGAGGTALLYCPAGASGLLLISDSWCRVCGGSGERHLITEHGSLLYQGCARACLLMPVLTRPAVRSGWGLLRGLLPVPAACPQTPAVSNLHAYCLPQNGECMTAG